ncbi:MAG: RloB family protein, partial [Bacteroidales bacterium]|nr:RloB family protein [Bacteroidales bacterium]
ETEEAYINYLRSQYRLPIEIKVRKKGGDINERYISNFKSNHTRHKKDETFLIYDSDVPEIVKKLKQIRNAELLLSNPCFEIWYLLHFQTQTAELASAQCISELEKHVHDYKKGALNVSLKEILSLNKAEAIKRAEGLEVGKNPSTAIYALIKRLDAVR